MYYYGGNYNYAPYPAPQQAVYPYQGGGTNWFAIVLVIFLLLIIVGVFSFRNFGDRGHCGCGCCREG